MGRYYENKLEEEYPDHPCPVDKTLTQDEARLDYIKGVKTSMGYLGCYCSKRFTSIGFDITKEEFSDGKKLCKDWLKRFAASNGFLLGIIVAICVANVILTYLLAAITKFEKRHSVTSELTSSTLKILIAQFINSVLVCLLLLGYHNLLSELRCRCRFT